MYILNKDFSRKKIVEILNKEYSSEDLFFYEDIYTIDDLIEFYGIESKYIQFLINNKIIIQN